MPHTLMIFVKNENGKSLSHRFNCKNARKKIGLF